MLVSAGAFDELPTDRCVAVAGGRAVVAKVGDRAVAFENRCLHRRAPLAGGRIEDGVLICPLHFWRYRLPAGTTPGSGAALVSYPVTIEDGEVLVDLPDQPEDDRPMRDLLLDHARSWNREEGM